MARQKMNKFEGFKEVTESIESPRIGQFPLDPKNIYEIPLETVDDVSHMHVVDQQPRSGDECSDQPVILTSQGLHFENNEQFMPRKDFFHGFKKKKKSLNDWKSEMKK